MSLTTTPDTHLIRSDAPILDVMKARWSTRNFDPSATIATDQLASILEAARWAPSAFNAQPWRFIPTERGTEQFDRVVKTLSGFNQAWAPRASALIVNVAVTTDAEGHEHATAEYDLGQAVAMMSLQTQSLGLHSHQMSGVNAEELGRSFGLPEGEHVVTVIAIGTYNAREVPGELVERESAPRVREPVDKLIVAPIEFA